MAAAATAERVAQSYLAGKRDNSGAMVSTGDAIYTYAVKLAYRDADGIIHTTPQLHQKYSVSTSRHQRAVYAVVSPVIGTDGRFPAR
jgi:hypothetical protein